MQVSLFPLQSCTYYLRSLFLPRSFPCALFSFLLLRTILLNKYSIYDFLIIWLGNNFNSATDNMFSNTNDQAFLIIESLLQLLLSNYRTLIKLYVLLNNYLIERLLIVRIEEKIKMHLKKYLIFYFLNLIYFFLMLRPLVVYFKYIL